MRVCGALERKHCAHFDAQIAGVEVSCRLLEDRPLALPLLRPNTDGAGIQVKETRRLRLCMAVIASSSQGLSTFETRSP